MVSKQKMQNYEHILTNIRKSKTIGVVDFHKLPAAQAQSIRYGLHNIAKIHLCGKKIIIKALNNISKEKENIEKLFIKKQDEKDEVKIPGVIYSDIGPFELFKKIQKQKSVLFARAGDIAQDDIIIPKGDTNLPPGPAISDLKNLKIKSAIKGQKITILEDKLLIKKGDTIDAKSAEMLMKLSIKPMKIVLNLKKCYNDNIIYDKAILSINIDEYKNKINDICKNSFNLAYNIDYPVSIILKFKITEASQQAKNLAVEANIINKDTIEFLLQKAHLQNTMLNSQIQN
ncbi:MAG: 50S ribosomal protein L10 [Candidatus Aenigmarchaeota archaeon ex4484_52]|nr:MAG: 50S ribosomal protein L10 [Candidatus Aenigmarchaeota archaeon ex4484_52]